jgi:hypothetical protein
MLKAEKESVHKMTSHLQLISGYLEMADYATPPSHPVGHRPHRRRGEVVRVQHNLSRLFGTV